VAVSIVSTWAAAQALPSGYSVPPPAAQSLAVPVSNTGAGGNWLFALCSWRTPAPGILTTVAVGDDAHAASPGCNVWEPLGAPNGTSPLSGNVAVSIWYCRNAFAAQNVYAAPTGPVISVAVQVLEVSGLGPWATLAGAVTGYAAAATTGPSLSLPAPSASSLLLTALASGNDTHVPGLSGAGWTTLPVISATNGTDHASDCALSSAYQVASGSVSSAWSTATAQDMGGVLAGVLVTGTAPQAPSQDWPYTQFLAGFGSGAQAPWDQVAFTDLTARHESSSAKRGKQYELDSIQAGDITLTLLNNDGALTPEYEGSPYFPWVQPYTPARYLATWPPPPAQNARTYSVWRGFVERWPQALSATRYQRSNAVATDVYALLTPLMRTLAQAEILADQPYAYWALNDPPGSPAAANLAKGNSQQLQVAQSKYGAGGALADFNVANSALAGDPGCTGWQQSAVPAAGIQGWCLYYQDTGLPALSGGLTVEAEFALNTSQPSGTNLTLLAVRNSQGLMLQARVNSSGQLVVDVRDKLTGTVTTTTVIAASILTGVTYHVAVALTQASWACWVNGGAVRTAAGACNLANTGYWLTCGGTADRTAAGGFANVLVAHLAVYGYVLPQSRIVSHWYSAVAGMTGQDTSGQRADRILSDGGCAYPRVMPAGPDLFTGAADVGGQAVSQSVVNVAESDSSWLMTDSAGYLFLQSRRGGYNLPALWTFGELQAAPLNANSQFTVAIAPWTAGNGATLTWSAAWSYSLGWGSMLAVPDGVTAGPFAASELEAVTPGTLYDAQAWVYCVPGWTGVHVAIDWYNASSAYLSSAAQASTVLNPATPTELTVAGRAPAGAVFAAVSVHMDGTPPSSAGMYTGFAALYPPTEYAYLPDITTDCDPSVTYNDVTLSQLAAPLAYATVLASAVTSGAVTLDVANASGILAGGVLLLAPGTSTGELVTVTAVSGLVITVTATASAHAANTAVTLVNAQAAGVTVTASAPASIEAYGDQTLQQTSYLTDPAAITDQAQMIVNQLSVPVTRIASMTLDPAANPALWPVVLGLETGQVAQVNRRLAGTQPEISGLFQVMSVSHAIAPGSWKTQVGLIPYTGQVLACDDTVRGVPGSGSALGW
jgi:hypothetical protein